MRARSAIEAPANFVAGLTGARRALTAILAGAISALAFAPFGLWPVLFLSFAALVWLLDGCYAANRMRKARLKEAALIGFWFGFGYFFVSLYWIAEAFLVEPERHAWLLPFVMTAMPGGMALFFAAATTLAILLWRPGGARALALAIAFALAEYARGHVLTGLPWNLLGYGLTENAGLMQLASLFGVYALSLIAVLIFASPACIVTQTGSRLAAPKSAAAMAVFLLILLALGYAWGERRLANAGVATTDVRLRIVQADIDQANKWRPENAAPIFNEYIDLSKSAGGTRGLQGVNLVIWPETAVPFLLADSPDALAAIGELLPEGASLLVGSARLIETRDESGAIDERRVYNSLLVIDDKANVVSVYDKIHLVPFGEYLPFQDLLESLGFMQMTGVRGGFSAGSGPRILTVPRAPQASPLICYEIIFPDAIMVPGERTGWLLNITNDAWFGTSAGPYQHFQQARIRAVEQGLPLVRAANTGISAIVDPYGRIVAELGLGERGVVDGLLPRALPPTVFVGHGPKVELSVLALALLSWFAYRVQRFA
ncbi:MAG TPA: apolipoprotein N-acyltransferase [Methyloceanibacter sp.]